MIAHGLNDDKIPCPSEYKRQNGCNYSNNRRLDKTYYWTYSTVKKILLNENENYIGNMVQGKHKSASYRSKKMVLTDESWHLVHNVRGAAGFVGSDGKAIPLTEQEIYDLGVEHHEVVVGYELGDSVKITDGPLEGFIGTVDELEPDKDRVRVVVSMFGRETPVDLELDQVEAIKD